MKVLLEMEIIKCFLFLLSVFKLRIFELGIKYKFCGFQYRFKFGENLDRLFIVLEIMEMSKIEKYKLRVVWFKVDLSCLVCKNKVFVGFLFFFYCWLFQCKCYVYGCK